MLAIHKLSSFTLTLTKTTLMKRIARLPLWACICLFVFPSYAQTPIDVAENTLKISPSSEEVFYYGFAEGDQLIFDFEEIN
jgi:hypothetical protein